jgi:hypothetical protein
MPRASAGTSTVELRRFSWVMAAALALCAVLLLRRHPTAAPIVLGAGVLFLLTGLSAPRLLGPVHWAWMKLATWLSAVMTFVVLTVAFFVLFTPMSLVMRLLRTDPLHRKLEPESPSYWVPVEPDGPGTRPDRPF